MSQFASPSHESGPSRWRENHHGSRRATAFSSHENGEFQESFGSDDISISFGRFYGRISHLTDEVSIRPKIAGVYLTDTSKLAQFSTECRQLGRSYALILASEELSEHLNQMLLVFYHNARHLSSLVTEPKNLAKQLIDATESEAFPTSFENVADGFQNFRERLNEFREYTNESIKIKALIVLLEKDLRYRANCLKAYQSWEIVHTFSNTHFRVTDQFNTLPIRRYVHKLTEEMAADLDNIDSALVFFKKYGLPAIQYEQKRWADGVLNMSTMATFFSAVTATTLQTSVGFNQTWLFSIIDTFWLCSLALSIGAALNSLLALIWKQTTYGTRGRRLPLWVTVWIHASAPIFLTLSIACFSAGLVLFSFASQKRYTFILTLASTAITSFGLVTVSSWIIYEQWIAPLILKSPLWVPLEKAKNAWEARHSTEKQERPLHSRVISLENVRRRTESISDQSSTSTTSTTSSLDILHMLHQSRKPISNLIQGIRSLNGPETRSQHSFDHELQAPHNEVVYEEKPQNSWKRQARTVATVRSATKAFWHGTSHTVPRMISPTPVRMSTIRPPMPFAYYEPSPISINTGEIQRIHFEYGSVQDLAYSPDGSELAITSYDPASGHSTTVKLSSENYECTRLHKHSRSKSTQVAWSPDGWNLLVRLLDNSFDLLDSTYKLISTIKRPHSIESVIWRNSSSFLTAERSTGLNGDITNVFRFGNILLRDLAVVPDSNILLVVGRIFFSRGESLPRNSRSEKQFISYDMDAKECRSYNPMLDDARHIKVARTASANRHGIDVLLGHKGKSPPQIWTLQPRMNDFHRLQQGDIAFHPAVELTGPGHFAGHLDEVIVCASAGY
ncbi:hypothetical protein BDZ94DRAFT_1308318 [Collybia nuda]|uniref:Uncharacterized protein n=1 Tax=Collybia nuda TaxID=64659 RepID=A0A9P6CJ81_9AGAR|nr:hypothetical protein BDZ94DRAFT_1308318 [Collybia nuda]